MKRKPVLPPTYLWATRFVMVALHLAFPVKRIIPFPWDLLGALPLALGAALNIIADKAFIVVEERMLAEKFDQA